MNRRSVWAGVVILSGGSALAADPVRVSAPEVARPVVAKVEAGKVSLDGPELLPKSLTAARAAYHQTRDYMGFLVRQERINGQLLPEQTAEIRARVRPHAVNVRVVKPAVLRGEETSYIPDTARSTVRFKPAGFEGVRGYQTLPTDHPKVLKHTTQRMPDVGLLGVLDRIDRMIGVEEKLGHPVAVVASDYTFHDRPVLRFEIYADTAHAGRVAHKCVVCFDTETKLPVRFELYAAPKRGQTTGDVLEVQSFVGLKFNQMLEDTAFER